MIFMLKCWGVKVLVSATCFEIYVKQDEWCINNQMNWLCGMYRNVNGIYLVNAWVFKVKILSSFTKIWHFHNEILRTCAVPAEYPWSTWPRHSFCWVFQLLHHQCTYRQRLETWEFMAQKEMKHKLRSLGSEKTMPKLHLLCSSTP